MLRISLTLNLTLQVPFPFGGLHIRYCYHKEDPALSISLLPFTVRLLQQYDALRLQADLRQIDESEWISHFNTQNYDGDWSGVPLRGPTGATHPI